MAREQEAASSLPLKAVVAKLVSLLKSWHHHHHHDQEHQHHDYCPMVQEDDEVDHGKQQQQHQSQKRCKCVKGYVPFYVGKEGEELERVLVKVKHLNHPLFSQLLIWSRDQLGVCGNRIPCEPSHFRFLMWYLDNPKKSACRDFQIEEELFRFSTSSSIPAQG